MDSVLINNSARFERSLFQKGYSTFEQIIELPLLHKNSQTIS